MRGFSTLSSVLSLLFLIAFMLLGGPILRLAYGPYYKSAAMVLVLLSAEKRAAVWAGSSCAAVLQFTSHQRSMLRVNLLTSPERRGETIGDLPGRTLLEPVGPPGVGGPLGVAGRPSSISKGLVATTPCAAGH